MHPSGLRRLLSLIAPEGLLLVLVAVLHASDLLPAPVVTGSVHVALLTYGVGALVAWRLRRNRVVLALLALALVAPILAAKGATSVAAGLQVPAPGRQVMVPAAALFILANFLLLGVLPDRAAIGRMGLALLAVVLAQAVLLAVTVARASERLVSWLTRDLLPGWLGLDSPIADSVLLVGSLALLSIAVFGLLRPNPVRRGILWATASLLFAVNETYVGGAPVVYLLTAGVVLITSVVESSFALAYRDALTGLPSRRAFNEELSRLGSRYTIAMVDVDRFKRINDRYGHDIGDQVLRMVAAHLARVSGRGRAFRYGGEEFAVIFAGQRLEDVVPHLQRLRQSIKDAGFTVRGPDRPRKKPRKGSPRKSSAADRTRLNVTVSIGAAERTDRLATPDAVIKEADRALYRAKDAGRDRVVA